MGAERDIGASRVLAVIALSCIRVAINYHPRWCRQVTITHGCAEPRRQLLPAWRARFARAGGSCRAISAGRSEEHTSELQSLMRISYAVFCLKKKKKTKTYKKNTDDKTE